MKIVVLVDTNSKNTSKKASEQNMESRILRMAGVIFLLVTVVTILIWDVVGLVGHLMPGWR